MTYTKEEVTKDTKRYFKGNELATNVFFKYALKDEDQNFLEKDPDDLHRRLSSEFARIEKQYPNPHHDEDIYRKLQYFKYIVPQGSPMYGVGNPKPVSLSNCFVIPSPEDNISSILDAAKNIANLSKRRGGVGLDISKLRPEGANVNNAAETSSGAWSFADLFSFTGRLVGQNGRRAALMITIDVQHPDVMQFVTMKNDKTKVTGANVSVRLRDDFMEAVIADEMYTLQWPLDVPNPEITREVKASDIWNLIITNATEHAEPGALMWDTMIQNLPSHFYPGFETLSTNPCGEIAMNNDSCRLISQCLKWYVNDPYTNFASFDWKAFEEDARMATRLSDDLVDLEIEKLNDIIAATDDESEKILFQNLLYSARWGRRTGLGTHGLADALARLCLRYDSEEALEFVDKLYEKRKLIVYDESIELAKERGAFPIFEWETEKDCKFFESFPDDLIEKMKKYGRRNIALLTNAPTGSVSIESLCDGSGCEPVFRFLMTRRRKLSHNETDVVPDFVDELGDRWIEFEVKSHLLKEYLEITGKDIEKDGLPDYFVTSDEIDWIKRVTIQAAMSKHIDHSISSTINLPRDTQPHIVGNIYKEAWKQGCKGVTVYVDGSRDGVLLTEDDQDNLGITYYDATPRPEEIECDIHQAKVNGKDWVILVGLLEGKPYEVMGGAATQVEIPEDYKKGKTIKRKYKTVPNKYDLKVNGFTIKDIVAMFDNPDNAVLTRMVSTSLRHGVRPSFLVEQLKKDKDASFASFSKVLSRVLKEYIDDGTKVVSGAKGECTDGDIHDLTYSEGCVICSKCGWTAC